jgi:hypothetical protein
MCYLNQDIDQFYSSGLPIHTRRTTFATLGRFHILMRAYSIATSSLGNGVSEYPPFSTLSAPFCIAFACSLLRNWREELVLQPNEIAMLGDDHLKT